MEQLTRINLPRVDSTNNFCRDMLSFGDEVEGMTLVVAESQTAGRGQQENKWESEDGRNLTFSLLCHPTFVKASEQFILSQCMALAIWKSLSSWNTFWKSSRNDCRNRDSQNFERHSRCNSNFDFTNKKNPRRMEINRRGKFNSNSDNSSWRDVLYIFHRFESRKFFRCRKIGSQSVQTLVFRNVGSRNISAAVAIRNDIHVPRTFR